MKAYNFVQKFCPIGAVPVGKCLGEGFHGEVFELPNDPDKVIKFSHVTEAMAHGCIENFYDRLHDVLIVQKLYDYPCYVKLFEHDLLFKGTRQVYYGEEKFILYSLVMEKLFPLSGDEKRLFKTICDAVEEGKINRLDNLIKSQHGWLDFNLEKVLSFIDQVNKVKIDHGDFRRQNIMKDKEGNFKLVDLDFAEIID